MNGEDMNCRRFLLIAITGIMASSPAVAFDVHNFKMIYRSDSSPPPSFGCLVDEALSTNGSFEWDESAREFVSDNPSHAGITVLNLKNTKSVNIEFDELRNNDPEVMSLPPATLFEHFAGHARLTETDVSGVETVKELTAAPKSYNELSYNLWFHHNLNDIQNWYDERTFELSTVNGSLKMNGQLELAFHGKIAVNDAQWTPPSGDLFTWPYTITCYEDE